MRNTPLLIEATPANGYKVHVHFEEGTFADVDLSYLLDYGGVFEPLRDPDYLRQLRADPEGGTIATAGSDSSPTCSTPSISSSSAAGGEGSPAIAQL